MVLQKLEVPMSQHLSASVGLGSEVFAVLHFICAVSVSHIFGGGAQFWSGQRGWGCMFFFSRFYSAPYGLFRSELELPVCGFEM